MRLGDLDEWVSQRGIVSPLIYMDRLQKGSIYMKDEQRIMVTHADDMVTVLREMEDLQKAIKRLEDILQELKMKMNKENVKRTGRNWKILSVGKV